MSGEAAEATTGGKEDRIAPAPQQHEYVERWSSWPTGARPRRPASLAKGMGKLQFFWRPLWTRQRTNIPRFFAMGDISSPLKMIVTAVAQAAVAAHQAYVEVRSPYWK